MDGHMCRDSLCPMKKQCRRYTGHPGLMQSYFAASPRTADGCGMFWGENSNQILTSLSDIFNGKLNNRRTKGTDKKTGS